MNRLVLFFLLVGLSPSIPGESFSSGVVYECDYSECGTDCIRFHGIQCVHTEDYCPAPEAGKTNAEVMGLISKSFRCQKLGLCLAHDGIDCIEPIEKPILK